MTGVQTCALPIYYEYAQEVLTQNQLWRSIPITTIQTATTFLQSYIQTAERLNRIQTVLQQRTQNVRFLFESTYRAVRFYYVFVPMDGSFLNHSNSHFCSITSNSHFCSITSLMTIIITIDPSNPSNVYACLRTIDAFGIQNVDIITQSNQYRGKAAIYQKRNMRTAMGSAKWLTITNYISTEDAIRTIREQHQCRIYASDLNPNAIDIRTIDWSSSSSSSSSHSHHNSNPLHDANNQNSSSTDQPICIVMGNEDSGISDTMRQLVDVTFTLPMVGFAESFNLSVATAIVLAHLSAISLPITTTTTTTTSDDNITNSNDEDNPIEKQIKWTGPIRPGDLSHEEYSWLYLKALINSLPQKRMARGMLKTVGITLPKSLNI